MRELKKIRNNEEKVLMLEAITGKQISALNGMGVKIEDSLDLDGYDLALLSYEQHRSDILELALQKHGRDFLDFEEQKKTFGFDSLPLPDVKKFIEKVKLWIDRYPNKKIVMGSHNQDRMPKYVRILKRFDINVSREIDSMTGYEIHILKNS